MPRKKCPTCQRPLPVCYCSALVQVTNTTKVLIIQHPLEEKHPFNTGRIAHLCLSHSELIVAERLSEATLANLLSTPSALLYPSLAWLPKTVELGQPDSSEPSNAPDNPAIQQLIVIDANWKKSKKILHLNPALQTLPRLNLSGDLKSNYQIRKTSMIDGLSTLESLVKAMQILEPDNEFESMLKPFEKMIALQQPHRNSDTG